MKISEVIKSSLNPAGHRIVLVLQGGGALGAYQAGVYQALHDHHLIPDWVVGTSIGAINAALIAGNAKAHRVSRMEEFWQRVARHDYVDLHRVSDQARRSSIELLTLNTLMQGVPGFFTPRWCNPFAAGMAVEPEHASFYDTHELAKTLHELVDFDILNTTGDIRLSVNAMKIGNGELISFDSSRQTIGSEHIMASGALPPGFPPVKVNGDLYWDGGLYSNTPLNTVLDEKPHVDTLCFMVDLWNAEGPVPTTWNEVETRKKDLTFASRSKRHLEAYIHLHKIQRLARDLFNRLPAHLKTEEDAETLALTGSDTTMHLVRLPYSGKDWQMALKDINFSSGSIRWRWNQGYKDTSRAIEQSDWLAVVSADTALVVHELRPTDELPRHAKS